MAEEALIATLEGFGTPVSSCVAVRENASGACQCARYGPSGSGPGFKSLCREAGLPIVIDGKQFQSGGYDMARALELPPPMDYAPIEGFEDDMGFFENVFDQKMLKPAGAALVGGMMGGAAYTFIVEQVSWFDADWKKSILAAGLGFAGARALWGEPAANDEHPDIQTKRNMAKGHLGAMGYVLAEKLVGFLSDKLGSRTSSSSMVKKAEDAAAKAAAAAAAAAEAQESGAEGLFGGYGRYGLADASVEQEASFGDSEVQRENVLADVDEDVSRWIS